MRRDAEIRRVSLEPAEDAPHEAAHRARAVGEVAAPGMSMAT
jgi:hypothetical protein